MKVPVETPWGRFEVRASPHGTPRILETAKTHPAFVGVGLGPREDGPERNFEKIVLVFSNQIGIDQFGEYLKSRGEDKQKFFDLAFVLAKTKEEVQGVEKWLF